MPRHPLSCGVPSIAQSPVPAGRIDSRLPGRAAERLDSLEPFLVISGLDHADDRPANWSNTDEFQNIALKARLAVLEKEPSIDEAWHTHGHDQTCRLSLQWSRGRVRRAGRECEIRSRDLFKKNLQIGRHVAEPERIDDHQMIGPFDCVLRFPELRRECSVCSASKSGGLRMCVRSLSKKGVL